MLDLKTDNTESSCLQYEFVVRFQFPYPQKKIVPTLKCRMVERMKSDYVEDSV